MSVDPQYLYAAGYGGGLYRGGYKTGLYYGAPGNSGTSGGQGINSLRAHPFVVTATAAFDRIAVEITVVSEAGGLIRIGIYADDGTGYPGNLIVDAGTVAADVLSSTTPRELTINQTLTGVVWLAAAIQNVVTTQPTVRTISAPNPQVVMGATTTVAGGGQPVAYTATAAGALPGTFSGTVSPAISATRVLLRKV